MAKRQTGTSTSGRKGRKATAGDGKGRAAPKARTGKPARKSSTGKSAAGKTRTKKTAAKKSAATRSARKKVAKKKPASRKPSARKVATKTASRKGAAGKKPAAKKVARKASPKSAASKPRATGRAGVTKSVTTTKPAAPAPLASKHRPARPVDPRRTPARIATTAAARTAARRGKAARNGGRTGLSARRDPRDATTPRKPVTRAGTAAKRKTESDDLLNRLDDLIGRAKRAGADAADAVIFESASLSQAVRLGEPETLERSESRDLGLRVLLGRRQAIVSSADFSAEALAELVDRAMAMVRVVPEDKFAGLADPEAVARRIPQLDLADPVEPAPAVLLQRAELCEQTARDMRGITNSLGADASWGASRVALVASNGFAGSFASSYHSVSVAVVAGEGTAMERDYASASARHGRDLEDPAIVGRRAAERTLRRLNPKKIASATMPVVFDRRVAGGLIGTVAGAANGSAIARGTSFLKDAMGTRILPEDLSVIDDPLRRRGLASLPFDGEGIATRRLAIVENGILASWVLDLGTARQLGLETTGHARRGTSSPPSPATTNLYLDGGSGSVDELIADIDRGILVTDLMGFGVNMVTGDYSRGAAGFLIEKGRITHPVSEITIAGNLKDMLPRMRAAGDLEFRHGTNAPTLRIDGMSVGGS